MGRDLRRYSRRTSINLFIGFILILLVGGGGLVGLIYGASALPTFLLCLGAGLGSAAPDWIGSAGNAVVRRSIRTGLEGQRFSVRRDEHPIGQPRFHHRAR